MHYGPVSEGRGDEHRRGEHATQAEGVADGRSVHARVKGLEPQKAKGPYDSEQAAGDQEQGCRQDDPRRQFVHCHGSITSRPSRNFARATEPTKPKSAIIKAMSVYTVVLE